MKIGIITWYFGSNYGAKAQSYALQNVITNLGNECFMIKYRPKRYKLVNLSTNLNVTHLKKHPLLGLKCILRCINFDRTNRRYNETSVVRNGKDIDNLHLNYIVFGSDAIFNVKHKLFDDIYMGVGINQTPKISYAPSCENLDTDFRLSESCIDSIRSFSSLSVRDENTKDILFRNTGRESVRVLDPTLLYDFSDCYCEWNEKDYILIYTFSDWDDLKDSLCSFARSRNMKIVAVGRYCRWADKSYSCATFEQWLTAFRYAEYVFTDSFHGTVFALKNKKEIILCSREDKRAKILSLLKDANIHRGFYDGRTTIDEYINESPMDYEDIDIHLQKLITFSREYLKNSLIES